MRILKALLLIVSMSLVIVSCKNQTNASDDVVIFDQEKKEISFKETSQDAVLLEYKFKKGTKVENEITVDVSIEMMGQTINQTVSMLGNYVITDVDNNGNALMDYTITRIKMESKEYNMQLDTDNEADRNNPQFAALFNLLNRKVSTTVTPSGAVAEFDFSSFLEGLGESGEDLKLQMEQNMNQFSQSSFPLLPDIEVKTGDVFQGEIIEQDIQGLTMKVDNQYTVRSISKDKTKIILDLEADFEFGMSVEDTGIELNNGTNIGWLLVDLAKGMVTKSYFVTEMDISASQMGQQMNMITITKTFMNTK